MSAELDPKRARVAAKGGLGVIRRRASLRRARDGGRSVWLGTATPSVANHALPIVPPAQAHSEWGWEESVPANLRRLQPLQRARLPALGGCEAGGAGALGSRSAAATVAAPGAASSPLQDRRHPGKSQDQGTHARLPQFPTPSEA